MLLKFNIKFMISADKLTYVYYPEFLNLNFFCDQESAAFILGSGRNDQKWVKYQELVEPTLNW